jgi:hypothetical protein
MPQKDRTGPQGQGAKTGQGLGKCGPKGGNPAPQDQGGMETSRKQRAGRSAGRGQAKGRGAGQARGNRR